MRRIRIGDIVEVPTKKGLSYLHYTHDNVDYGELIQVKEGFFAERPKRHDNIVEANTVLITFFPLRYAVKDNVFEVVGHLPVPERFQKFPTFRVRGVNIKDGKAKEWWFWNGTEYWPDQPVRELTAGQRNYPIKEIWNDTLLIERIESGYTPDQDPTTARPVMI